MKRIFIFVALLAFTVCTVVLAQTSPSAGKKMLADRHIAEQGFACADCHSENNPKGNPAKELCLDCHGSWDDLAALTAKNHENPHNSHRGPEPCETCHHSHKKSVLICDQCHSFGTTTP